MPSSSVSDGVQSLITERYPGTIYCAVETSGDGAVNFQSRVQMYLFKARQAAAEDFERALEKTGLTVEKLRDFLKKNPKYAAALHRSPHYAASTPADLVHEVAEIVDRSAAERALRTTKRALTATGSFLTNAAKNAPSNARAAAQLIAEGATEVAEIAKEKGPGIAAGAVSAAREKLAKVLPFARRSQPTEPSVAAAE
jgi:hypothetical protein